MAEQVTARFMRPPALAGTSAPPICTDGCCTPALPHGPSVATDHHRTRAARTTGADECCASEPVRDAVWLRSARLARFLAWASLTWMTIEGTLGLGAGIRAGSVGLVGWALSSVVEGLASAIVIWRFTGARTHSARAEATAQRAVAVSFWLLAPYVAAQAVIDLVGGSHPSTSSLGIALTISSIVVMPVLGIAKRRLGRRLDSGATAGEGAQNMLCAYLAAGVLAGLLANAALGWWWVDPVAALAVATMAVLDGRRAWRGEDCC